MGRLADAQNWVPGVGASIPPKRRPWRIASRERGSRSADASTPQQPKRRFWRDVPGEGQVDVFWWVAALGVLCIGGAVGEWLLLRDVPWMLVHEWKVGPDLWPHFFLLGLVLVVAAPAWLCAAMALRRRRRYGGGGA